MRVYLLFSEATVKKSISAAFAKAFLLRPASRLEFRRTALGDRKRKKLLSLRYLSLFYTRSFRCCEDQANLFFARAIKGAREFIITEDTCKRLYRHVCLTTRLFGRPCQ